MMAKRGRLARNEMTIPPNIVRAIAKRAAGGNWEECAEVANTTSGNLRRWRLHPDFATVLEEQVQSNLEQANNFIAENTPALASRLVELGLDKGTRPYAAIQAISTCFQIISTNITEKENKEALREIKRSLDKLEGNNPEIIDI